MRDYAFGNLVTRLRTELGLSQFQLGKLIGVSDKAVSKWENGNAKPRIATCCRLADILGVSLDELLSAAGYGRMSPMKTSDEKTEAEPMQEENRNNIRQDLEPEKRIELHVHTGMSLRENTASSPTQYIQRAAEWSHPAIAITDFGSIQAFPEAFRSAARKQIKFIPGYYGCMLPQEDSPVKDGYAVMLLAQNRSGIIHLNELISLGYTRCYKGFPCMPRAWIQAHREGLLIGCSCNDSEIEQGLNDGMTEDELVRIASFYDYLEIEPVENETDDSEEQARLRQRVMAILRIGKKAGIPVAAVSNAEYLDPEDAICRSVIRYNNGFLDKAYQPPYYLRTTAEMLEAFRFLGEDTAREVVIHAPQRIADRIDPHLSLMPGDGKCYPVLPEAKATITELALTQAHLLYGESLPSPVEERLNAELVLMEKPENWTIFEIARLAAEQSHKDGYPVCSRGTVGSSFIAWLTGISEINPLAPHYRCPACRCSDFDINPRQYHIGADLPARNCPDCGSSMNRDGFAIPFETLFGLDGEKEPDIDLNFSAEEQSSIHEAVREKFGRARVFRPGVIQMLSDLLAKKYVRQYFLDHHLDPDSAEAKRVTDSLSQNVKITEGKHPAGLYILPENRNINEFTPVQFPANDSSAPFLITHYSSSMLFNSLFKMDLLGHDTPTLLHLMTEFTGIQLSDIPLNDPQVLRLFTSPEGLGVTAQQILSATGTYGIPEFQADSVRSLLTELNPTTVEELIRILGISHGTGIWNGNAQGLIASGTATCITFPSLRDEIMKDLIQAGIGRETAYRIMQSVRLWKGPGKENADIMRKHGIPEWYIEACQRIGYLFPRAHNAAYTVAALQIAWFKLYCPEAFYRAWFTVRQDDMEETDLTMGPVYLRRAILAARSDIHTDDDPDEESWTISEARQQRLTVLELMLEMQYRGINLPAKTS